MDLKDVNNKDILLTNYKKLWAKFESLTKSLIDDPSSYKRSALLYYWLNQYYGYLKGEPTFSPRFRPAIKKGNIIKVNFGFNIGNEFGGLHYAIAMTDSSPHNGVVTVIPLRSLKPHEDSARLSSSDVFLDNELYLLLSGKLQGYITLTQYKMLEAQKNLSALKKLDTRKSEDVESLKQKIKGLQDEHELIKGLMKEIGSLKSGSVALINQIRTVSKIRIVDPTKPLDILYGIRLSREKMQLVKDGLLKLYDM